MPLYQRRRRRISDRTGAYETNQNENKRRFRLTARNQSTNNMHLRNALLKLLCNGEEAIQREGRRILVLVVTLFAVFAFVAFMSHSSRVYNPHPAIEFRNKQMTSTRIDRTTVRKRPESTVRLPLKVLSIEHMKRLGRASQFHKSPGGKINSPNTHYGEVKLNFLAEMSQETSWSRKIHYDKEESLSGHVYKKSDFEKHWDRYDNYYAVDDDAVRNEVFSDFESNHCRRVSWHRLYNPNCNLIHESEIVSLGGASNKLLG